MTTMTDDLEARLDVLDARDRRHVRVIAGLVVAVMLLGLTVGWLARTLDARNDSVRALTVLVERQDCTDRAEARWEDAVSQLVVAAASGDEPGLATATEELAEQATLEDQIEDCPD